MTVSSASGTSHEEERHPKCDDEHAVETQNLDLQESLRLKAERRRLRRLKRQSKVMMKKKKKKKKENDRETARKLKRISPKSDKDSVVAAASIEKKQDNSFKLKNHSVERKMKGSADRVDKDKHSSVNVHRKRDRPHGNPKERSKKRKQRSDETTFTPRSLNCPLQGKDSTSPNQGTPEIALQKPIKFPINEECTSLSVAPSCHHVIAGFTDGTLRLFDTTGRLWNKNDHLNADSSSSETNIDGNDIEKEMMELFDCDSSESESEFQSLQPSTKAKERVVMSRSHQNFGAVACQIHAKGVITSLLMDVACCEDGLFAFGGVLRGSTELVAVDLSELEEYHNQHNTERSEYTKGNACILDLIKVHRFSDAKLKGFGACTRVTNCSRPEYRLFTGKGIKVRFQISEL